VEFVVKFVMVIVIGVFVFFAYLKLMSAGVCLVAGVLLFATLAWLADCC
jgi:hypothetical protein